MASLPQAKHVLVLGGGDGMAVRELLRYPQLDSITLVDLDADMTRLFATHSLLTPLNGGALTDPKVRVINADAFQWLRLPPRPYDFIVVDLPDPGNYSVGKLYTTTLYHRLKAALAPGGAIAVQSTSPWVARQAFWCVDTTLRAVGFQTVPYHAHVPSFGAWGFVLASLGPLAQPNFRSDLRFLSPATWTAMQEWPADMAAVPAEVNRLNNQVLVRYFTTAWNNVN